MSVSNQAQVAYSYDNANRLIGITQGTSAVSFAYDNANRRTSLTLPNGVTMSYSYDNASELTGISYTLGQNSLGNLTYGYDLAGRRTRRVEHPPAILNGRHAPPITQHVAITVTESKLRGAAPFGL